MQSYFFNYQINWIFSARNTFLSTFNYTEGHILMEKTLEILSASEFYDFCISAIFCIIVLNTFYLYAIFFFINYQ